MKELKDRIREELKVNKEGGQFELNGYTVTYISPNYFFTNIYLHKEKESLEFCYHWANDKLQKVNREET